ncbi:MAG TPA: hypothetical protein VMX12_07490 [Acidimicrobiia bacterium]|nr:hypothetical protein [Acidimicrobiia bacterium]
MADALTLLATAWSQPFPREQVAVYAEFLADIPRVELDRAVAQLVATGGEFRPSAGEIRRKVVELRGEIPSDEEAMAGCEALDAFERERSIPMGARVEPLVKPGVHPSVVAAWESVGADALPAVFVRAWREERERLMVRLTGASLKPPPELGSTTEIGGGR